MVKSDHWERKRRADVRAENYAEPAGRDAAAPVPGRRASGGVERVGAAESKRMAAVQVDHRRLDAVVRRLPQRHMQLWGHGQRGSATKTPLSSGANLYQTEGSLNGVAGRFEWIVDNGNVTHRLFVPGGTLNGVPIKP